MSIFHPPFPNLCIIPLVWQLRNWTRLDTNAHQSFATCSTQLFLSELITANTVQRRYWYSHLTPCPAPFTLLLWSHTVCHIQYAPFLPLWFTVCHSLPQLVPELLAVLYFTKALLAKEASTLKYSAAIEQTSELCPASSRVPSAHCVLSRLLVKIVLLACSCRRRGAQTKTASSFSFTFFAAKLGPQEESRNPGIVVFFFYCVCAGSFSMHFMSSSTLVWVAQKSFQPLQLSLQRLPPTNLVFGIGL